MNNILSKKICKCNFFHIQALENKERTEKLIDELEKAEKPQELEVDKEGITEEEKHMLRKIGLKMKPFLLMGGDRI